MEFKVIRIEDHRGVLLGGALCAIGIGCLIFSVKKINRYVTKAKTDIVEALNDIREHL